MNITKKQLSLVFSSLFLLTCMLESLPEQRYFVAMTFWLASRIIEPKMYLSKRRVKVYLSMLVTIVFLVFLGALNVLTYKNNINYGMNDALMGLSIKLTISLMVVMSVQNQKDFLHLLAYCLTFHVTFFFFQTFLVYATGYYMDVVSAFSDEASRYGSGFSLPIIGTMYRPTGLYVEPSTYASFIVIIIILRGVLAGGLSKIDWIALASVVITLSIASMFYGFLVALLFFIVSRTNWKKKIILSFLSVLAIFSSVGFIIEIISRRIEYTAGTSISIRKNLFDIVINNQTVPEVLFGNGILGYPTEIVNALNSGTLWSSNIAALNDNGIWLFIIMKFGVVGLFAFLLYFKRHAKNLPIFFALSTSLLTKVSILNFTFIFFFLSLSIFNVKVIPNEKDSYYK